MKDKNKEFIKGEKFFEGINFWQKQIAGLKALKLKLKLSKAESKKFPQKIHDQVEIRTSAERMIIKQLHHEIEHRKEMERLSQNARDYAENIIDTVREPLIVLDADLRVNSANRSFFQTFKVKLEETRGELIYNLGNHQWDIPKLRELLEDILPKTTHFEDFEVEHVFPDIGKRIMLLNARKVYREFNNTHLILLAIEDITERRELGERLRAIASHDDLTGCVNFRSTLEILGKEISRSDRYKKQFSIAMIDIDDFKVNNDKYGHQVGNDVLAAFAKAIKSNLRSIDSVGRYGGDEFIIIFPETAAEHVLIVLERIKDSFKQVKIDSIHSENANEINLQFSAGIVAFPHNAKDLKELIWVADSAMFRAKNKGKSQVNLEKRSSIRLNPAEGTRAEIVDSTGKENILSIQIANISRGGMLLYSVEDILGEELLCRIYPPQDESPLEVVGKLRHKVKSGNEPYRIGIHFPDISESSKEKLSRCIGSQYN